MSVNLACHCCGGLFQPRTEDNHDGRPCCTANADYCVDCLKCRKHCRCKGKLIRGYYEAWLIKHERAYPGREDKPAHVCGWCGGEFQAVTKRGYCSASCELMAGEYKADLNGKFDGA